MALPSQSFYDISGKSFIIITGTSGKKDRIPQDINSLLVDSNDCIYSCGKHYNDNVSPADTQSHTIMKHTELGHLVWQQDIGGADGNINAVSEGGINEFPHGMAIHGDYIYTIGSGGNNVNDSYMFKYNKTTGDLEWKNTLGKGGECIAVDSSGNVYICGDHTSGSTHYGWFCKFNSSGTLQWQKLISGLIDMKPMVIDSSDNIFICGKRQDGGDQPATLYKFDTDATLEWTKNYHLATYDSFYALDFDSSGNIYVAGHSTYPMIMKLNSSGTIQWCRRIGTGGMWNSPKQRSYGVVVDSSDKIYIIGRNGPNNSSWKALIVKFDSSGTEQWRRDFGIDSVRNSGHKITVDSRDNIVIQGDHDNNTTHKSFFLARFPNDGSATGYHIVGSTTYVYGKCSESFDIQDLSGWTTTSPSATVSNASLQSVSSSSLDNNSYTATSTTKILDIGAKYFINITGSWGLDNVPYDGNAITLDSNDIIYSCGYYREDDGYPYLPNSGWLGQYSQHGKLEWQRSIGGSNATTWADPSEIIMDSAVSPDDEYVYVVGHNTAGGIIGNGIIFKYNKSGTIQWKKDWGGNTNDQDLNACVTDSSGNLYVAGEHHYTGTSNYQGLVMKLNSSGVIQWQKLLGSRTSFRDMTIDSSDNIYVTGSIDSGPADNLVVKFNSSGSITWQRRLTRGSSNYWESSGAIAVDSSGNVYITGFSNHDSSTDDQPFLLKLDSDGIFQWARSMGNYAYSDRSETVTCDSEGYVYWGGIENPGTNNTFNNAVVIKFNSSGSEQWKRKLSVSNKNTYCYSVKTDLRNDFVCSGNCWVDGGYGTTDQWIARFPGDGTKTGTYPLNGDSWVYASSSITVATSSGWSVTNPAKSLSNISYSVSNSSQSDASYTHSTSTVHI